DEAMPAATAVTNIYVHAAEGHSYSNLRLSNDAGGLFALDAESGVISTTQSFDFETDPTSYQIVLTVDTDEGSVNKLLNVALNDVAEGSAHRSLRLRSHQNGWTSRANVQLDSPRISLGTGDVLDSGLQSSDGVRLSLANSTAASNSAAGNTPVTTDLALGGDELDDIFSALEGDWQDLFGDEGENPFSDL
ncbi:MAG TPA: cadherin repeat domain-containing protein, partial [Pirellulales bacterium]|nr:cadherin repeat domain-containing protein [Pirellulales bacterium]